MISKTPSNRNRNEFPQHDKKHVLEHNNSSILNGMYWKYVALSLRLRTSQECY